MEGSADVLGSWEMADLDESMSRLLVSSQKTPSPLASSPSQELAEEAPPPAASASQVAAASSGRGGEVLEDAVSQVDGFLREALEKPRERLSILRMEQDVVKFIHNPTQQQLEFQGLPTSYLRLAAHRVAQHYYLQSLAVPDSSLPDGSGSCIVLRKTSHECCLPPIRLADIPVNLPQEDSNIVVKVAIKQRPQKHSENTSNATTHPSKMNYQKSVEERKEEYNRARARIFSIGNSGGIIAKSEDEPKLLDRFQHCTFVSSKLDENSVVEGPENSLGRVPSDSSSGSNRANRNTVEKEPTCSRYRPSNRVAIFRDREVDRKDPDYDRSYERYLQRFDPGFGFNGGPYTMQPLYSPAVNYNTEFPQFVSSHMPQLPIECQPRTIPQHLHGPWSGVSTSALGYGPTEGLRAPFNPNHVGAHPPPSIYMHSSQYPVPPCHGMTFVHHHEHIQPFTQAHQQQSEASFGLARPR
ncbi:uncharacterized protein [Elaeis guineensis]|uniref:uncharacterized protein n=1 Tax=Elaeis guineensis var. tenera TaxID=51953 RepID=UPI003C6D0978